jgi:hypothetical protein
MSIRPALGFVAALAFLAPAAGAAIRGDFGMDILVNGRPVRELPHQDRTYVEAQRGKEYAVRLTNRTGERVAVALAVDGLNSIDAKRTSAREARKWILGPWETIVIEGWQTSGSTARRFFFTTEDDSYGAWLGRKENLGVISAAFFREKPRPVARQRTFSNEADEAAPPSAKSSERRESAATGIGREIDHRVRQVAFEAESDPAAVVDLRYEYRDALIRLGVLRPDRPCDDRLARRERARGFEDSGFAPDPFRRR